MKFLITWQIHEGKLHETLKLFSEMTAEQEQALMGESVRLVSRWHDLIRGSGAAIFEAESAEALTSFSLNWNEFMDLDVAPVVDDDGARALGRQLGGDGD